jgi:hypothetical protein
VIRRTRRVEYLRCRTGGVGAGFVFAFRICAGRRDCISQLTLKGYELTSRAGIFTRLKRKQPFRSFLVHATLFSTLRQASWDM